MEACVLLGDVVESRHLADRAAFSDDLKGACAAVNDRYGEAVVAPAAPLKGIDELGVVVDDSSVVYGITKDLLEAILPARIRVGVAAGRIDVGAAADDVATMDGPAFHRADELVTAVREDGLLFDADLGNPTLDRAIADEINLLLRWRTGLGERPLEYLRAYRHHGTQAAAADALGVSQQAVSKGLRRVGWPFVDTIERRLETTLEEYPDVV